MPCNSSYLEQRPDEAYRQRTARLYVYVRELLGDISPEVDRALYVSNDIYAREDFTPQLCETLDTLSQNQTAFEQVVYNARDANSRDLADWWEKHQENDRKRKQADAFNKLW